MITALIATAVWAVPAAAVLYLLTSGRRRRDRQAQHNARALRARQHAASWGREQPTRPRPKGHRR